MLPFVNAAPQLSKTPSTITNDVRKLCARLSPGQEPFWLPVTPEPDADANYCYQNVERKIAREGGSIKYGWQIWEIPGIWLEAEFHALWYSLDGRLVDITPKVDPTARILFLPDPRRTYEGKQISNEYLAISKDPRVNNLISIKRRKFVLLNRGERANVHGTITLEHDDAVEYAKGEIKEQQLLEQLVLNKPKGKPGRNEPCKCGSGRKYKHCCGK